MYGRIPVTVVRVMSAAVLAVSVFAVFGVAKRVMTLLAGAGFYCFASFNGIGIQTLALIDVWSILVIFVLFGDSGLHRDRLLRHMLLFQVSVAVFFSGVEKVCSGWLSRDPLGVLFAYPAGFMVRDWVTTASWLHVPAITRVLSVTTVIVELVVPIGLWIDRTARPAAVALEIFFLLIVAALEIPPLFYGIFAAGGMLVLDDERLKRMHVSFVKLARRRRVGATQF